MTGWAIGDGTESANGNDTYSHHDKLERTILPHYYTNQPGWIAVMKGAICKSASYFSSHRMMRRYATEAYLR